MEASPIGLSDLKRAYQLALKHLKREKGEVQREASVPRQALQLIAAAADSGARGSGGDAAAGSSGAAGSGDAAVNSAADAVRERLAACADEEVSVSRSLLMPLMRHVSERIIAIKDAATVAKPRAALGVGGVQCKSAPSKPAPPLENSAAPQAVASAPSAAPATVPAVPLSKSSGPPPAPAAPASPAMSSSSSSSRSSSPAAAGASGTAAEPKAASPEGSSDAAPAPASFELPPIKRVRICLLGGDAPQPGVGKGDVAAALLRGITSDWPGAVDPIFDLSFERGVFERAWSELLKEPSDAAKAKGQMGDRWGMGPLGAWCSNERIMFDKRPPNEISPPYDDNPDDECASLCAGNSEKLSFGHARSKGTTKQFREALELAGQDLDELERVHKQLYAAAEAHPQRLVQMNRPCKGLMAAFARFSPGWQGGDFAGCGAAILDIFEEDARPLASPKNVALLYAAAPNGRAHKGLCAGSFLNALRSAGSNIARMMREYNWLAGVGTPREREREDWWETDVRAQVEYYLSDRNLKSDQLLQQRIASDPECWLDTDAIMSHSRIIAAGVSSQGELLDVLVASKLVETKVAEDGRAFVRRVGMAPVAPRGVPGAKRLSEAPPGFNPSFGPGLGPAGFGPGPGGFGPGDADDAAGGCKRFRPDGPGFGGPPGGGPGGPGGFGGPPCIGGKCGGKVGKPTDTMCWEFSKGFCARGDQCRWVHIIVGGMKGTGKGPPMGMMGKGPPGGFAPMGKQQARPGPFFQNRFDGFGDADLGLGGGLSGPSFDGQMPNFDMPLPEVEMKPMLLYSQGQRVAVQGLLSRPEYNEQEGECKSFDEPSGRWSVQMGDGSTLLVKEANLRAV